MRRLYEMIVIDKLPNLWWCLLSSVCYVIARNANRTRCGEAAPLTIGSIITHILKTELWLYIYLLILNTTAYILTYGTVLEHQWRFYHVGCEECSYVSINDTEILHLLSHKFIYKTRLFCTCNSYLRSDATERSWFINFHWN